MGSEGEHGINPAAGAGRDPAAAWPGTEAARLLVVDDSQFVRYAMVRHLVGHGYTVEEATGGAEGLRKLRESHFDLVLLDIMMPDMDGYVVLEALKGDEALSSVPVIMLSSVEEVDSVVKCIQLGAEDYLPKSSNPVLIDARIRGCLERRRAKLMSAQLGRYRLERRIGRGGMAEVFLASHAMLRRPTAVKLLRPWPGADDMVRSFETEVQSTSQLTHPNTIAVYDYGRTPEGLFYYAMEYLDGVNVNDLVVEDGPQPEARTCNVLKQVCGSLAEAHRAGLIHRDVKPSNIMLCERGGIQDFAKVLDFGIAQLLEARDTSMDQLLGTPAFMAPEAITDPARVDGRSDIYALGCVAYYLLTGQFLFDVASEHNMLRSHVSVEPVPPSERSGREISAPLEQIVMGCLAKNMADRPQDALELAQSLDGCPTADEWNAADMQRWWDAFNERRATDFGPPEQIPVTPPPNTLVIDFAERDGLL